MALDSKKIMASRDSEKVDKDGYVIYAKKSLGKVKNSLSDQGCYNVIQALNSIARLDSKESYIAEDFIL